MLVISGIHLKFQEVYSRPEKMHSPTEVETFCWDSFLERDKIIYYVSFQEGVVKKQIFGSSTKKKIHFPPPKKGYKTIPEEASPTLRPPVPPPPPEAPPVPPTPPSDLPALPEIPPLTPEASAPGGKGAGDSGLAAGLMKGNHPFPNLSHLIIFPHLCFFSKTIPVSDIHTSLYISQNF